MPETQGRSGLTRRDFVKVGAASVAAPTIIPASALGRAGRPAPSERITMALVGCGGMGRGNLNGFLGMPGAYPRMVASGFERLRNVIGLVVTMSLRRALVAARGLFGAALGKSPVGTTFGRMPGVVECPAWMVRSQKNA